MNRHLYVMSGANRPGLKVGMSFNPAERLKELSRLAKTQITLQYSISVPHKCAATERMAHWLLRDRRISGEWFDVTLGQAMGAIDRAIEAVADRDWTPPWPTKTIPKERSECFDRQLALQVDDAFLAALEALRRAENPIPSASSLVRRLVMEAAKSTRANRR